MKHNKKYCYLILLLILSPFHTIYGNVVTEDKDKLTNNKLEKLKFGFELGGGFSDLYTNWRFEKGIFGEYKLSKEMGFRIGLLYANKSCSAASVALSTILRIKSIDIPITLRLYPISNWDGYCFFVGIQPGYILDGNVRITQRTKFMEEFQGWNHEVINKTLIQLNEQTKVQRLQLGIIWGFNYEFGIGLNLGFNFYSGLIDIIKAERFDNSNINFTLGYNLAKLLKYLF
jgi:hypothetical protein